MRVMFVTALYPPYSQGGGAVVCANLAETLALRGFNVSVFAGCPDSPHLSVSDYELRGVKVRAVNLPGAYEAEARVNYYNPEVEPFFERFVHEVKPKVIHFQSIQALGVSLIAIAHRLNIPVVVTMHDWFWLCPYLFLVDQNVERCPTKVGNHCRCGPNPSFAVTRRNFMLAQLDKVDRVLVPSKFLRESLIENGLDASKLFVNENGLAIPKAEVGRAKAGSEPIVFGYVGGLNPYKGHDLLLKAFRLTKRRTSILKMAGMYRRSEDIVSGYPHVIRRRQGTPVSGNQQSGKTRVAAYLYKRFLVKAKESPVLALKVTFRYIRDRLRLLWMNKKRGIFAYPYLNQSELDLFYRDVDVLLLPSIMWESFSLVVREAFLRGVPVVATVSGGSEELIVNGENGLIVQPEAKHLARALQAIIDNPRLIQELRSHIMTDGIKSVDDQVDDVVRHYKEVLAAKKEDLMSEEVWEANCSIRKHKRIKGKWHYIAERPDGMRFLISEDYLSALKWISSPCVRQYLKTHCHLENEEVQLLFCIFKKLSLVKLRSQTVERVE